MRRPEFPTLQTIGFSFLFLWAGIQFCSSQDRPNGPAGFGPPPGFGPGGPPMLPPLLGGGRPGGSLMILSMPEVHRELKIAEDQKPALQEWLTDFQQQSREIFTAINPQELFALEDAERQKRLQSLREKLDAIAKSAEERASKFLMEEQRSRLHQLRLQDEGVAALNRPEIVKSLELSDEQKSRLQKLTQPPAIPTPFAPRPRLEEALEILNVVQKEKFSQLKGAEFKFPPMNFGPGGPMAQKRKVVAQFDKDKDGKLNSSERADARKFLKTNNPAGFRGPGGPMGPPGMGPNRGGPFPGGPPGMEPAPAPKPGLKVDPSQVQPVPETVPLYDLQTVRTLFLGFEAQGWEEELADFYKTDVEVPAKLQVDGKSYRDVGVHFRGMSSFGMVRAGSKRSLNIDLDYSDSKQRLLGYKTLNLLNAHEDPTFLHAVLYLHVARNYIPAPKANFVRLVINGESWGLYTNVQQFNKEFIAENFPGMKGTRWKVQGSPNGRGGLEYLGEKIDDYKSRYDIKSNDDESAWKGLIQLCKTLNETPPDQMEAALKPMLDLDGVLWFLALEATLINNDGYWVRASDYSIFREDKGKFHLIPHDANETFSPAMMGPPGMGGPGMRGPGTSGNSALPRPEGQRPNNNPLGGSFPPFGGGQNPPVELDPLVGMNDPSKPLRSKLLAVPALREKYLRNVRTIARDWLDWEKINPLVTKLENLIDAEIQADTKKLTSYESFKKSLRKTDAANKEPVGHHPSLQEFAEKRREFLLNHPEIKQLKE